MAEFRAEVDRRDGVAILRLHGQVDGAAGPALTRAFDEAQRTDPVALLLGFDEVSYLNSTGIALVVGVLGRARSAGVEVRVCGLSEHFRHIFEITRLADFMRFFPDEDAAVTGAQPVG
jgi:anti-sigma B factor antagonist